LFSITDICNIAIQIERNGEALYRQASEMAENRETSAVLAQLADDELKHARWFADFNLGPEKSVDYSQLENAGRELLQGMMENQTFSLDVDHLSREEQVSEILEQSIAFENDTVLFYEMLSNFIEDAIVMDQLTRIIEEEKSHVEKIKGLLPMPQDKM
jgi:rubrerythrin